MKTSPIEIWGEYQNGTQYLMNHDIYEKVKINERFWDGRQWEGLDAKNLPKPVFNILQRAGKYMVSTIGSNDIAVNITPFSNLQDDAERAVPIAKEVEHVIEHARMKEDSKVVIRNAFVDGWGYMMQSFNPDIETGQDAKGVVENQLIDCTCVYFGNPYSNVIQTQPYIIVSLRQDIHQVKKEAKECGLSKEEVDSISPDNEGLQANEDDSTNLVTVLIKYYKVKRKEKCVKLDIDPLGAPHEVECEKEIETVWFTKTTRELTLIPPTDLGYKRYPIACFGWDIIKNSYCYNSPMTSVIPNQIFINKCYAIAQMYGLQSAFPKIIFDKNKVQIDEFLNNTNPSAVAGIDIAGKFVDFIKIPDFSNNIIELAQDTMAQTKECLGVTDASLGNVKPDNTSAIIALQEASSIPLEIQKQSFFVFWEDVVRNILDIIACSYGVREVLIDDGVATVDFSMLKDLNYNLDVDIGNGAQFSQVAQINTLDKLVQAGYIDPATYIEVVPSRYMPQKSKLLKSYQERMAQMQEPQSRGSTPADEVVPL